MINNWFPASPANFKVIQDCPDGCEPSNSGRRGSPCEASTFREYFRAVQLHRKLHMWTVPFLRRKSDVQLHGGHVFRGYSAHFATPDHCTKPIVS